MSSRGITYVMGSWWGVSWGERWVGGGGVGWGGGGCGGGGGGGGEVKWSGGLHSREERYGS